MTQQELRRLARLGAEARLRELEREIAAIHTTFPDLRSPRRVPTGNPYTSDVERAVAGVPRAIAGAVTRRRRPRMSREARERIGEAQRKRWKEWRAKNGKAAEGTAGSQPVAKSRKKR